MAIEVELKAWVSDPDALRARLDRRYSFVREYVKEDVYFAGEESARDGRSDVRLRRDGDRSICTFKDKRIEKGVEFNEEHEFDVTDGDAFHELLRRLGCLERIRKTKIGRQYKAGDTIVELSELVGLGWFVEIERVLDDESESQAAELSVREVLSELDIPTTAIECRTYTEMLAEKVDRVHVE